MSIKKLRASLPIVVIFGILIAFISNNDAPKKRARVSENQTFVKSSISSAVSRKTPDFRGTIPASSEDAPPFQHFSEKDITDLGKELTRSANYLNQSKAMRDFQTSKFDTAKNYNRAFSHLLERYPEEGAIIRKNFIKNRIIATNFLKYTKQLTAEDCNNGLSAISDGHQRAIRESTRINLAYDAAFLSERCSKIHFEPFREFVEANSLEREILAQANHYLAIQMENKIEN